MTKTVMVCAVPGPSSFRRPAPLNNAWHGMNELYAAPEPPSKPAQSPSLIRQTNVQEQKSSRSVSSSDKFQDISTQRESSVSHAALIHAR